MGQHLERPAEATVDRNELAGGWGTIARFSRTIFLTGGIVLNCFHGALALLGGLSFALCFISCAIPALVYLLGGRVQSRLRSAMIAIASGWMLVAVACPFLTREASPASDVRIVWTARALFAFGVLLAATGSLSERRFRRGLST